jgi:hypothetical protein
MNRRPRLLLPRVSCFRAGPGLPLRRTLSRTQKLSDPLLARSISGTSKVEVFDDVDRNVDSDQRAGRRLSVAFQPRACSRLAPRQTAMFPRATRADRNPSKGYLSAAYNGLTPSGPYVNRSCSFSSFQLSLRIHDTEIGRRKTGLGFQVSEFRTLLLFDEIWVSFERCKFSV